MLLIFDRWIGAIESVLDEMIKQNRINSIIDPEKGAQAMVAMLEGGILMKQQ